MADAEISIKVGNLCEYQCKVCDKIFKCKSSLHGHFVRTNHTPRGESLNLDNYLVKTVLHECQLCSKMIICELQSLLGHLLRYHHIKTIEEYTAMTKAQEDKSVNIRINFSKEVEEILQTKQEKYEITKGLDGRCKYECNVCHRAFKNWRSMKEHVMSRNHGKITSIRQFLKHIVLHKCNVCHEIIFCDFLIINKHLRKHKLTIKSYKEKKFKENIKVDYAKQYKLKLNFLTKDVPVVKNLHVSVSGAASLADDKVTRNTGNICLFKCSLCPKQIMSYSYLLNHSLRQHNLNHVKIMGKIILEARYHSCHICNSTVLCDNKIIGKHVGNHHQINLLEYQRHHVLKNGAKVFPTLQDFKSNPKVFEYFKQGGNTVEPRKQTVDYDKDDNDEDDDDDNGLIQPHMLSSESEESD